MRAKDITMGYRIGRRISDLRTDRFLSQRELAEALDVARETVAQWENGTRRIKDSDIVTIAAFFGITCDYLLRGGTCELTSCDDEIYECTNAKDVNILISSGQWKLTATRTVYTLKRT